MLANPADGESLEWLNAMVAKLWPKIDEAALKIVNDDVVPEIRNSLPSMLRGKFRMERFTLGTTPPVLGPIESYHSRSGLRLKIGINFDSNVDISMELGASVGIR